MLVKVLEIRDRGTCIVASATKIESANPLAHALLRHAGFGSGSKCVQVTKLTGGSGDTSFSPYGWGVTRTMPNAHKYIEDNFDQLESGAIIDVEFILGESSVPKTSDVRTFYDI